MVLSELKKKPCLDLNCQLAGGRNDEGLRGLAGGVLGVDTCSQQLMQDTEKDSHLTINQLPRRINDAKEWENYVTPVVSVFPFPRIPNTLIIPQKRTAMHFVDCYSSTTSFCYNRKHRTLFVICFILQGL